MDPKKLVCCTPYIAQILHILVNLGHATHVTSEHDQSQAQPAEKHDESKARPAEKPSKFRQFFELGDRIYDHVEAPAGTLRALIQMVIGVSAFVLAAVSLIAQFKRHTPTEYLADNALIADLADTALTIVGVALGVSAVIELAYTLFTHALDEAIDPVILGIAAFILIKISKEEPTLEVKYTLPILLLAGAILVLFLARRLLGIKSDHLQR
jgi:hypothetical protein